MALWPLALSGQEAPLRYNTYGAPGLIDMPIASSAPDAELAFSMSSFAGQTRNTVTFQASPRLSASFRYADLDDVLGPQDVFYDTILDRSLALHYRFLDAGPHRPALAIGVTDFVGTGIYSGEYLVATTALRPDMAATLGLGWGRFAGIGGFHNPLGPAFSERPERVFGQGGTMTRNAFFRGDAALFGGLHWQASDALGVTLEYSSDAYPYEDGTAFHRRVPINIGVTYAPQPSLRLSGQYLYGSELGVQLTYVVNPMRPPYPSGFDLGPAPVRPRSAGGQPSMVDVGPLARALQSEGLTLHGLRADDAMLAVSVENNRYTTSAQAVGRAARVLTRMIPVGVSMVAITLMENGLHGPPITLRRADLELAEYALHGSDIIAAVADIALEPSPPPVIATRFPTFSWGIGPYLTPNLFDPDNPLRADFGMALDARWEPAPGLVASATLHQRLIGNLADATRVSTSVLPHVRSDFARYDREGDADIMDLTLAWYGQPSATIATRLTAGLFETMYGGISGEILWRPAGRDLAFGVEVNQLWQRDYGGGLGFFDGAITSGHASVYWQIGQGYQAQLDAGHYLAGDWGATLTLARQFRNGWSLGAFATFTDVSFADFGEGSFDKGLMVTVPLSWISGQPRRDVIARTIRPVTRDGGARVDIEGRLYALTQPLTPQAVTDTWGSFWR